MELSCPLPLSDYPNILMAHGSGGKIMQRLIEELFFATFGAQNAKEAHDSAVLDIPSNKIAMTTDSFVVQPLIFPGGDIGSLAVHGTVNDIAMSGAKPLYLSTGFILEEGLPMETLAQIVRSMKQAADEAGVKIVTGDTKVVERGHGDGIYINTAGIGVLETDRTIHPQQICAGDVILINGDLGRHGMAIMSARENLSFESPIKSDSACLVAPIMEILHAGLDIKCMRDATRGGLAALLNEIASSTGLTFQIDECSIPVNEAVRGACEILGFDPLHVANEGRFALFVAEKDAKNSLDILQKHAKDGAVPAQIGKVTKSDTGGMVTLKTALGSERILDMPGGELLPRIC